jgi:hypothetical protein
VRPFQSDCLDQIAPALVAAQAQMGDLQTDKKVKAAKYEYSYASLSAIHELTGPVLAAHGLAVIQMMVPFESPISDSAGKPTIQCLGSWRTVLLHTSGQFIAGEHPIAGEWGDPGNIGGATTTASRYNLKGVCALSDTVDPAPAGRAVSRSNGHAVAARQPTPPPRDGPDILDLVEDDEGPDPHSQAGFRSQPEVQRVYAAPPERRPPPPAVAAPRGVMPINGPPCPYPNFPKGGIYGWIKESGLIGWFAELGTANGFPERVLDWNRDQVAWACNEYEIERHAAAPANGHAAR